MLGLIKRTFVVKTPEVMLNLYKTLVRPHLEYCISAWSPHNQKDKKLIEKVQHRFTRMITSIKSLQYEARLQKLGLWTLEERRKWLLESISSLIEWCPSGICWIMIL